jgi:hypothetical protein
MPKMKEQGLSLKNSATHDSEELNFFNRLWNIHDKRTIF